MTLDIYLWQGDIRPFTPDHEIILSWKPSHKVALAIFDAYLMEFYGSGRHSGPKRTTTNENPGMIYGEFEYDEVGDRLMNHGQVSRDTRRRNYLIRIA